MVLESHYITLLLDQSQSPQWSRLHQEIIHHNPYNCGLLSKWQPPTLSPVILDPSILILSRMSPWSVDMTHYSVYIKAAPPSLWGTIEYTQYTSQHTTLYNFTVILLITLVWFICRRGFEGPHPGHLLLLVCAGYPSTCRGAIRLLVAHPKFLSQQFGAVCGNDSSQTSTHLRSRCWPKPSSSSPLDNRARPMANTSQAPDLEGLHREIHGMSRTGQTKTRPCE